MRIGIYDPYLDTMSGGEKYMLTMAEFLSDEHEVFLLWDKDTESLVKKAQERFALNLEKVKFSENIFSPNYSFWQRFKKSKDYDAIIILSDGSLPYLSCRTIVHFQSPVEWVKASSIKTKLKLRKINKIICNSQYTKSFIDKKFKTKSMVIYPPVNLPQLKSIKKENIILNVGRFGINQAGSSYKKQDMLARSFGEMVSKGLKDWELVLVVSVRDEDKKSLSSFQSECKGLPIKFIVNPEREALWNYYQKAKIYWHASGFGEDLKRHPDRAEHFGISTVEAMSTGTVPVVINAGGQKEIVVQGENGFLWDTQDELLSHTLELMKNEEEREKLGKQAQKKAQEFDLSKFGKAVRSVFA